MKRSCYLCGVTSVLFGILLSGFLGGCWQSVSLISGDEEAVRVIRQRTQDALNRGDAEALVELFTENAVFILPDGKSYKGKDAIKQWHEDFFRENPGVQTQFRRKPVHFGTSDMAVEEVTYVEEHADKLTVLGGDTTVLLKQDGRWMIDYVRIHTTKTDEKLNNTTRRVVTGYDENRKSVFVLDGPPPRTVTLNSLSGFEIRELWTTEETPKIPVPTGDPTVGMKSFVPRPGGSCFRLAVFPPGEQGEFDPDAFRQEFREKLPGLAETLEQDLAMHTTDTIDYGVVIRGEITLELDDGATVILKTGDCYVQNGTRHAWHNRGTEPCLLAVVLLGAER
ncbi:MAG: SgcJ/EcaC family oxidoreductase [Planctomycetota bacterium]